MFPGPKTTYVEENAQNDGKTEIKGPRRTHLRLGRVVCASCTEKVWGENVFSYFLWVKPGFLAQTQRETLPINTAFLVHNFSFKTGAVQEKGIFSLFF